MTIKLLDYKTLSQQRRKDIAATAVFIFILLFAAILRLSELDAKSLSQDESSMLHFVRGLLDTGYPSLERGSREIPLATYELLPYFIAISVKLLGWSEQAVRLPAALFGISTLVLIYLLGLKWFGRRVALLAALLYAISPWALFWSKNCFYPSQLQFFLLLSIFLAHRMFVFSNYRNGEYYVLAAVLVASYLTWEASALQFLVYGFLGLTLYWNRWSFLGRAHAWLAFGMVILVLIVQLARRGLHQYQYLAIGSSRASISSPQLALDQPTYNSLYYIENIFFNEQHIILSILFLVGVLFLKQDKTLRFVYGYVFVSLLVFTELLAVYSIRYMYFILPLFLIGASATAVKIFDWILDVRGNSARNSLRAISFISALIFLPLQAMVLNKDGLYLSELRSVYRNSGAWEMRPDLAGVDYRHVVKELKKYYREGDIIITRSPFLLELYSGLRGDYMLQSVTVSVLNYDPVRAMPYYSGKFVGNPVLRNRIELEDVLQRHDRVWFLATPLAPTKKSLDDELSDFITASMQVVAEGSNVRLYLWESQPIH